MKWPSPGVALSNINEAGRQRECLASIDPATSRHIRPTHLICEYGVAFSMGRSTLSGLLPNVVPICPGISRHRRITTISLTRFSLTPSNQHSLARQSLPTRIVPAQSIYAARLGLFSLMGKPSVLVRARTLLCRILGSRLVSLTL